MGISGARASGRALNCAFLRGSRVRHGLWRLYPTAVVRAAGHGWGTGAAGPARKRAWGGSESQRDDADLVSAEFGHFVAVGGQEGTGFCWWSTTSSRTRLTPFLVGNRMSCAHHQKDASRRCRPDDLRIASYPTLPLGQPRTSVRLVNQTGGLGSEGNGG
ncbi:hypothetical protein J2S51_003220 [Streptomyces sp. DSM 41269]|nr:hypothetical protein [Streptomyces sp. DSM 41269]